MMKIICSFIAVLALTGVTNAAYLIPSKLDSSHAEAREKAFIPWSTPEEGAAYWKKLSSSNVPIYKELKDGNLGRDIYIQNPGIGYWVLGGLSEKALWKTHDEKLKIGDELVSASVYKDQNGDVTYWALWAPDGKSHLLKDKMRELGITPASVELSPLDKLRALSSDLAPYTAVAVFVTLLLNIVVLFASLFLILGACRIPTRASGPDNTSLK